MLFCRLSGSGTPEDESKYLDFQSLANHGWTMLGPHNANYDEETIEVFNSLGLSTADSANRDYHSEHDKDSTHEGIFYGASKGYYANVYNADGGMIVAGNNQGPTLKLRGIKNLIPLRQYSDVVFLTWRMVAGDRVKGLKYIMRHFIVNEQTIQVMEEVLGRRGERLKPWPGVKIEFPERDALALLGTPNGRGVGWMLIQHKRQLGLKTIRAVTIFQCFGEEFCMLFWIEDLRQDEVDMPMPPDLQTPPVGGDVPATGGPAKRSAVVPINNTTSPSTFGLGERLMRAMSKRAGDVVKNFWTGLRLF
jgi:hypothetical protein